MKLYEFTISDILNLDELKIRERALDFIKQQTFCQGWKNGCTATQYRDVEILPNGERLYHFVVEGEFIDEQEANPQQQISDLIIATADICPHGTSISLCEWCNYKSRIPHLELALHAALERAKKAEIEVERLDDGSKGIGYESHLQHEIQILRENNNQLLDSTEKAKTELVYLKNPSDGRCMEIAALREGIKLANQRAENAEKENAILYADRNEAFQLWDEHKYEVYLLKQQLLTSTAREMRLRDALESYSDAEILNHGIPFNSATKALSEPCPALGEALHDLTKAALDWWKAGRPDSFSVEDHLNNPTVNRSSESEDALAKAVSALVALDAALNREVK